MDLVYSASSDVLGAAIDTATDDTFTVAIIGDSYMWGQGLRYNDTVASMLQKKLNKHRKSEVLLLAYPGDDIVDHVYKYEAAKQVYDIDAWIIQLFENDAALHTRGTNTPYLVEYKKHDDKGIIATCQNAYPQETLVYDVFREGKFNAQEHTIIVDASLRSLSNMCVFEESLELLPRQKAVYFLSEKYVEDAHWTTLETYLKKHNKYVVTTIERLAGLHQFSYVLASRQSASGKKFAEAMSRSKKEGHRSKLGHELYAEILYNEIVHNKELRFFHSDINPLAPTSPP